MRRPRNEPPWCIGDHDQIPLLHRSNEIKVGREPRHTGNGVAFAWLQQGGDGPTWVGIGVAHMASASVEISLADAAAFRDALDVLLEQAHAARSAPE